MINDNASNEGSGDVGASSNVDTNQDTTIGYLVELDDDQATKQSGEAISSITFPPRY